MNFNETIAAFRELGGVFITDPEEIKKRVTALKGLIFDWDGVFNDGSKGKENSSNFSETDVMGTNMLRFSIYLRTGKCPPCYIITGESNPITIKLARREHFTGVYFRCKNKGKALDHILQSSGLSGGSFAFFFDDILDLAVAGSVGVRCLLGRSSSPLFKEFAKRRGYCDYQTGQRGGQAGLREACELLTGLNENYDQVVDERMKYEGVYLKYLTLREKTLPQFYEFDGMGIREVEV